MSLTFFSFAKMSYFSFYKGKQTKMKLYWKLLKYLQEMKFYFPGRK